MTLSIEDMSEIRRLTGVSDDRIIGVVQQAIQNQQIVVLPFTTQQTIFAGGTNMCPNSDFSWSQTAATVAGTLPGDAGAENLEVYHVTRQKTTDPISAQRLRTAEADAWVPIWERVIGVAEVGAAAGSDNYDIAFQFTNNWLQGNRKWYIRVAVATADDTPLPSGSRLFAGFWVKRTASEGWVTGGNFDLTSQIFGIPGTKHVRYKVIAKTDTGVSLESQVLDITTAPDTLDQNNYVQIRYSAAAGFIEFELYREDVASGEIRQIVRVRDSSQLVAYDTGQEGVIYPGGFPAVDLSQFRAYAEVPIDAVSINVQKTFHNLGIRIPSNFDTSDVLTTYLRIGIVDPTTNNRQVFLDTVWAAETFNIWGPSPFDAYPSGPSTTMTTSTPSGGAGTGGPPSSGGGSSCVWTEHDLRLEHGWIALGSADDQMKLDNGIAGDFNRISHFINGEISQYLEFTFDCGLVIRSSLTHRFIRDFNDSSGIVAEVVEVGQILQGGFNGSPCDLMVIGKELKSMPVGEMLPIRAVQVTLDSSNKFYSAGDSDTGWHVYFHNRKLDDPDLIIF